MRIKNLPEFKLTENQIIWLSEAWKQIKETGKKDRYKNIRIRTVKKTGNSFIPSQIDKLLIRGDYGTEITLLGVLQIEPDTEIIEVGNKIFKLIKNKLLEDPEITEFHISNIAETLKIDDRVVRLTFHFLSMYGSFYSGASSKSPLEFLGYETYKVDGNNVFEFYMNFISVEDCLSKYYEDVKLHENKEEHKSNDFLSLSDNGDLPYDEDILVNKIKNQKEFSLRKFIDNDRLQEIKIIKSKSFDYTKLVKLCEELNDNFSRKNYYSVAMLIRAILDHIPPMFDYKNFKEFVNNYSSEKNSKSFKESMLLLEKSKSISHSSLHSQIRSKEVLPSEIQVDVRNHFDILLSEIIRISKK